MPRPLDEVLEENWRYSGSTAPVRQEFGWGDRFGAAVDSAQANLYGVAEAAGSDWAARQRRENQAISELTRRRAVEDTGAPDSYKDVRGVRDAARYVGGLAVDTAPQMAAIAAGGMTAGPLGVTTTAGRLGLAAAASYPFNVGDVLQNQREQAGDTNLASAAALAVPYTAADLLGVEGAVARGQLSRNAVRALDGVEGAKGMAARTAASTARTAVEEGAAETFQEGMNQFGRMAVDPNETFYNERSAGRFGESAVGGAALGGAFGGAAGGWRRSHGYTRTVDDGPMDLTQRQPEERAPLGLQYNPLAGTPVIFPDGSVALNGEQELDARYPNRPNANVVPIEAGGAHPGFADWQPGQQLPDREFEAPDWSTAPGAGAPRDAIPFQRDVATGGMALRAPIDTGTMDLFTGNVHLPSEPEVRPDFQLERPDPRAAAQEDLDLQQPSLPTEPPTPKGAQRGVPGQLPFSSNTGSPKGQILMGLVDSLQREGHLEGGADVQAATLVAQGKFAAAKKIIDQGLKEKAAADSLMAKAAKIEEKANESAAGATAQRAGDAAVSGAVQRAGGQRDAAGVQQPGPAAPAPASPRSQDALAVPANAERAAALEPVTSEALVQVADDAKDIHEYESALDELYRRWRDDGDETATAYFEANTKVPGFSADLARVRERAGENKPQAPAIERGKRGLRLGRQETGALAPEAKQTDSVLRGLATPKFQLSEGEQREVNPQRTARIQAYLDAIVGKWENQPKVVVLDSITAENVPEFLSDAYRAMLSRDGEAQVPVGLFNGGKIYIFADAVQDSREATATVFHEGLGHYGLRGVFGKALIPVLDSLARARPDLIRAKAREYGLNIQNQVDRLTAAEEVLAELAESRPNLTWVKQAIAAIRTWLRENVALFRNLQVSDDEIARDYLVPARDWVERGKTLDEKGAQRAEKAVEEFGKPEAATGPVFRVKQAAPDQAVADSFARFPYAKSALGKKIQDALFNIKESPWALKWTTNDQIAEGYKHLKPVQEINRATGRMAAAANRYLETASQTAKKWRALPDDVQLAMQKVMLQSTMDEMHVSIKDGDGKYLSAEAAWNHASNNHIEKTPTNRGDFGKLYQQFHGLPTAAKTVYDQVRDDLARQHDDTLRALRKSVADQFTGQLKRVLTDAELESLATTSGGVRQVFKDIAGLAANRTELRALENLYTALRDVTSDFGTIKGPYFPLVRFGDHVVVMKSADLVDLELKAQGLRAELQNAIEAAPPAESDEAEGFDAKIADIRSRYNRALEAVQAAKQDERKYVVEFHESAAQAERARQALAAKHPSSDVYRSVREQYYRALDGASPAFLKSLQDTLAAALDAGDGVSAEAKSSALQSMKDMYLRRQPERSALRAELKRMSIDGVQSAQMLRGYAQSARNGAWRISRLLHAGEVTSGLASLSEDRRSADAKHVLNELKARFVGDIAPPEDNRWLQRLQSATYFMHLGFNISYFTTNATQAWTTSLPVMGGRHGIVNSANSLMAASRDVIRLLSQATAKSVEENGAVVGLQLRLTDEQINSLAKDAGEAQMLKQLTDDGVIDITIKHDLGAISDGTSKSFPGKVLELSSALANYPELYNRLSTALAAYRMEAARREYGAEPIAQVQERAERYAEYIINRTHFNYSPENAPRMMRGQLGRLLFQFKRYQQGMIYLFAKLVKDASNGDADAARSLAYLLGMTTAVGGVVSLPIAAPMALAAKLIAAMFPDDDEPELLAEWYNGMKDGVGEHGAQLMAKGLPTLLGLDVSGKLGQGDLLNPVAFADTGGKKFFSKDYWAEVGFSLLGPSAAMLGNEMEAVGAAKSGDYLRAAEKGLPTFVANAVKAYRRAEEGLSTKSGDTLMEPEEFSAMSTALKAVGFEGVKVSDTYQNRAAYMNMLSGRQEARQGLLRKYYEAVKSGDSDAMQSVQSDIREFNDRQPADRVRGTDLSASIKQHGKRAAETKGGLRVGKRDADTYRKLSGDE